MKTGVRGDAIVVNGKTWPELAVHPTSYYPFGSKAGPGYVRHSWTTEANEMLYPYQVGAVIEFQPKAAAYTSRGLSLLPESPSQGINFSRRHAPCHY